MHDASPPRTRLVAFVASFLAASAFAGRVASAADEEPQYFAGRFGGRIDRVAVGSDGTIYIAGRTPTTELPASTSTLELGSDGSGAKWAFFAAAIESDGRPRWTSYATGEARPYDYYIAEVATAPDGSVWIAGNGYVDPVSAFQEGPGGWRDAFFAKFAADGTLLFASILGGEGVDDITGLAVMPNGDAVLAGITSSRDFPGAPLPDGPNWATDAFVARVRADGSGIVWARRFGSDVDSSQFHCGGVVVDPSDGTIVVGMVGAPNQGHAPFATTLAVPRAQRQGRAFFAGPGPTVVRLDAEGTQIRGALFDGLGTDWNRNQIPIAIDGDGSVLVGGLLGVARTTPELFLAITDAWVRPSRGTTIHRIRPHPSGRVVVADSNPWDFVGPVRIAVREASLGTGAPSVDRTAELGFVPNDVAVDGDGALIVVGFGNGVPFNASFDAPERPSGCIARLPLDGVRAPTRLRARAGGPREAYLTWSRDGDAAEGYDIERVGPEAATVLIAHVPGNVFRHPVTGLTPGSNNDLRVVAVFASGVRSASPVRTVTTPPETSLAVVAEDGPGQAVQVRIDDDNGAAALWQLQRRFGDGPWMETGLSGVYPAPSRTIGWRLSVPEAADRVPDVAVPVTYRARAFGGGGRTAWTESSPLFLNPTALVTQTSGQLHEIPIDRFEFVVAGTLAPSGPAPLSFDPATEDFRLLYGTASAPSEFVLRAGYPGWTFADGRHEWSAARSLTEWGYESQIVLDFEHGRFSVRLIRGYEFEAPTTQIAVNLAFGQFSGGDVRAWRGRSGWAPELLLGSAPSHGAGARAR